MGAIAGAVGLRLALLVPLSLVAAAGALTWTLASQIDPARHVARGRRRHHARDLRTDGGPPVLPLGTHTTLPMIGTLGPKRPPSDRSADANISLTAGSSTTVPGAASPQPTCRPGPKGMGGPARAEPVAEVIDGGAEEVSSFG